MRNSHIHKHSERSADHGSYAYISEVCMKENHSGKMENQQRRRKWSDNPLNTLGPIDAPAVKEDVPTKYEDYLFLLQQQNRILKKLKKKNQKQIDLERKEHGFSIYLSGANFDKESNDNPTDVLRLKRRQAQVRGKTTLMIDHHDLKEMELDFLKERQKSKAASCSNNQKLSNKFVENLDEGQHGKDLELLTKTYEDDFESEETDETSDEEIKIISLDNLECNKDENRNEAQQRKKNEQKKLHWPKSQKIPRERKSERLTFWIGDVKKLKASLESNTCLRQSLAQEISSEEESDYESPIAEEDEIEDSDNVCSESDSMTFGRDKKNIFNAGDTIVLEFSPTLFQKKESRLTLPASKKLELNELDDDDEAAAVIEALKAENEEVSKYSNKKKLGEQQAVQNRSQNELEFQDSLSHIPVQQKKTSKEAGRESLSDKKLSTITNQVLLMEPKQQLKLMKTLEQLEETLSDVNRKPARYSSEQEKMTKSVFLDSAIKVLEVTFELITNWGDPDRVGLTEIQVYNLNKQLIHIHPDSITAYNAKDSSHKIDVLFNGKAKTTKEKNMWTCRYDNTKPVELMIPLENPNSEQQNWGVSRIRIWNYNHSLRLLDVGVKHLRIFIGGELVFDGDLNKGCGNHIFDYSKTIELENTNYSDDFQSGRKCLLTSPSPDSDLDSPLSPINKHFLPQAMLLSPTHSRGLPSSSSQNLSISSSGSKGETASSSENRRQNCEPGWIDKNSGAEPSPRSHSQATSVKSSKTVVRLDSHLSESALHRSEENLSNKQQNKTKSGAVSLDCADDDDDASLLQQLIVMNQREQNKKKKIPKWLKAGVTSSVRSSAPYSESMVEGFCDGNVTNYRSKSHEENSRSRSTRQNEVRSRLDNIMSQGSELDGNTTVIQPGTRHGSTSRSTGKERDTPRSRQDDTLRSVGKERDTPRGRQDDTLRPVGKERDTPRGRQDDTLRPVGKERDTPRGRQDDTFRPVGKERDTPRGRQDDTLRPVGKERDTPRGRQDDTLRPVGKERDTPRGRQDDTLRPVGKERDTPRGRQDDTLRPVGKERDTPRGRQDDTLRPVGKERDTPRGRQDDTLRHVGKERDTPRSRHHKVPEDGLCSWSEAGTGHLHTVFDDDTDIKQSGHDEDDDRCTPMQKIQHNRAKWRKCHENSLEESWGSLLFFNHLHRGRLSMDGDTMNEYLQQSKKNTFSTLSETIQEDDEDEMYFPEDDNFVIPELPSGKELFINIRSTWGDRHYVGLTGVDIFTSTGEPVPIAKISADPEDINILPEYSKDPRVVANLIDTVNRTRDDVHMWLTPFTQGKNHFVYLSFDKTCKIALIRIWNYNKSRIHSFRGAKDVEMKLDGTCIFKGEIARACGGIEGGTEAFGDTILFTMDEKILEAVSRYDDAYEGETLDAISWEEEMNVVRPQTAHLGDDLDRPFTRACGAQNGNNAKTSSKEGEEESGDAILVKYIGDVTSYRGRCLQLNFTATWGDVHYIGLTGLEVLDKKGEALVIKEDMLNADLKDLRHLAGNEQDARTLDKLVNGTNVTMLDEDMWLIPFAAGQNHLLTVNFDEPILMSGLRIWNYNKTPEDTYRGAKIVHITVDGKLVSPPEGLLLRKGPGNCHFDFVQEILFAPGEVEVHHMPTTSTKSVFSDEPSQEYESAEMPCGFIYQFQLFSTWGDPYYIGLNGLEFYDAAYNKINLSENNIAAFPDSVNVLSSVSNDARTPDKLVDGYNDIADGTHTWLSPVLPTIVNKVYVIFDQPTVVSLIKIWNYSKTVARGTKEFALLVDDLLVYNGTLDAVSEGARGILPTCDGPQRHHTILFSANKSIFKQEKHTVISNQTIDQDIQMTNNKKIVTHYNSKESQKQKPVDQALRPTTSVTCNSKRK